LNANGPFFNRTSVVMQLDPRGMPARPDGNRLLTVSSYEGNTPEAQITILLHELGHIIGRLPEDGDSLDDNLKPMPFGNEMFLLGRSLARAELHEIAVEALLHLVIENDPEIFGRDNSRSFGDPLKVSGGSA